MLSRHNKGFKTVEWNYNTEGFAYKKLSELEEGKVYPIHGLFITGDHGYGLGAAVIMDNYLLDLPGRCVDQIKDIIDSDEDIEQIKAGRAGIKMRTFTPKNFPNKIGYDIDFVDIEE